MKMETAQRAKEKKGGGRRILALFLILLNISISPMVRVAAVEVKEPKLTSEAYVLMEGSTGEILCEKNATKQMRPASITKIMTLLLIFEAIENGKISLTDEVPVSEHAASMGGSQVYLEPYEKQPVEIMIKCICIASANDASVAMAEFLAGSEKIRILSTVMVWIRRDIIPARSTWRKCRGN